MAIRPDPLTRSFDTFIFTEWTDCQSVLGQSADPWSGCDLEVHAHRAAANLRALELVENEGPTRSARTGLELAEA